MKKEKRVWILCVLGVLLFILLIVVIVCFLFKRDQKEEITHELQFKDVQEVNYGSYDLSTFVADVVCETDCFYHNEKITYSIEEITELGLQKLKVQVEYLGINYEKEFEINVVDKEAPVMTLSMSETTIAQGEEFDPNSFVESVKDNYDDVTLANVNIENKVNSNELGDYEVIYSLKDSNGNLTSASLMVHVVAKEEMSSSTETQENQNLQVPSSSGSHSSSSGSSSSNTSSLQQDLNRVTLSPLKTRNEELDNQIGAIVSSTTNSSMSNYNKLRALYDYVKQRLSYSVGIINLNERFALQDKYGYYNYDAHYILNAQYALQYNTGVCDNYAALFMILARRVGFEAYVINGQYTNTQGDIMGHAWVMINTGGKYYIFDPQIEDNYGYDYFGINPDITNAYYYNLNGSISNFHNFTEDPTLLRSYTLTLNISGAITTSKFFETDTYSFDHNSAYIGEQIAMELVFSRSQEYSIKVTSGNTVILEEDFNGDRKVINYTFEKAGDDDLVITVENYKMRVEYHLTVNVKQKPTTTE